MTILPDHLEFGNLEHIKALRQHEKEVFAQAWLEKNKGNILHEHWKQHSYDCGECLSHIIHGGDVEPEIEIIHVSETEVEIKIRCMEGADCDERWHGTFPI